MTNSTVTAMADEFGDVDNGQRVKRILKVSGLLFAAIFLAGVCAGAVAAATQKGGVTMLIGAIVSVAALLAAACLWLAYRIGTAPSGEAPPTRKERLNRNILVACGALGGLMAMLMMFTQDGPDLTHNLLSNEPLQPAVAIVLLVLLGVVTPLLSFVWHRSAVDEQEVAAYKTGALWGINVYMIGAPIWWIGWRGGFLPAPDGVILYFATVPTMAVVWMWKKYF